MDLNRSAQPSLNKLKTDDSTDPLRRAAGYADRILKGEKAGRPSGASADHREGAWTYRPANTSCARQYSAALIDQRFSFFLSRARARVGSRTPSGPAVHPDCTNRSHEVAPAG
jgi:hypothetical protein